MSTLPDGGPAFPMQVHSSPGSTVWDGMALRDWFAGQTLNGWLANFGADTRHPVAMGLAGQVALDAYALADAMLAERAKEPKP